jgi:hypothetical protein
MKIKHKFTIFILLLSSYTISTGQNIPEDKLNKNYLSDGQEYILLLNKKNANKINVVFYPDLEYKIKIKTNNKSSIIEMNISDTNGTLLYSNQNKKYAKEWNFKFQSLMNASIDIKLISSTNKEENVRVQIAFRKSEKRSLKDE